MSIKYLIKFLKTISAGESVRIIVFLFLSLIAVVIALLYPLLFKNLIDIGLSTNDMKSFLFYSFSILILLISSSILDFYKGILSAKIESKILKTIREKMYSKILTKSFCWFKSHKSGEITQRFMSDTAVIHSIFGFLIPKVFSSFFLLLGAIVILASMNILICLLSIMSLVLYVIIFKYFNEKLRVKYKELKIIQDRIASKVTEICNNIKDIKVNNVYSFFLERFNKELNDFYCESVRYARINTTSQCLFGLVSLLGPFLFVFFCGFLFFKGSMTIGSIIAFSSLLSKLFNPAMDVFDASMDMRQYLITLERLDTILNDDDIEQGGSKIEIKMNNIPISINNLSYKFETGKIVLQNISMQLERGKVYGLIGKTGCGKSTLIDLLLGLNMGYEGSICFYGTDAKELSLTARRNMISAILQDSKLFGMSIQENIKFGRNGYDYDKILNHTCLIDFVKARNEGSNSIVNENSLDVSGGERQRICIARAFFRPHRILIMDESTSALDKATEYFIMQNIINDPDVDTILLISHRKYTLQFCDHVFFMKDGKIAASVPASSLIGVADSFEEYFEATEQT